MGDEYAMRYTDGVLQNCTLETYMMLLAHVALINLIKNKTVRENLNVYLIVESAFVSVLRGIHAILSTTTRRVLLPMLICPPG